MPVPNPADLVIVPENQDYDDQQIQLLNFFGICLIQSTQIMKSMTFTSCKFILDRPSLRMCSKGLTIKQVIIFLNLYSPKPENI